MKRGKSKGGDLEPDPETSSVLRPAAENLYRDELAALRVIVFIEGTAGGNESDAHGCQKIKSLNRMGMIPLAGISMCEATAPDRRVPSPAKPCKQKKEWVS